MKFYWKNRIGSLLLSIVMTLLITIIFMNFEVIFLFEGEIVRSTIANFLLLIIMIVTAVYGYLIAFGICKLTITDDEIIDTKFAFYHIKMKRKDIRYAEVKDIKTLLSSKKVVKVYGRNFDMILPNFGRNAQTIKEILDKPLTMTSFYE